jgi:HlyD family secretion protein
MNRKKSLRWLVAALVVAGAGYWFFVRDDGERGKDAARYTTLPVEQGRITAKVTATGTLSALVTVQVGSQVSGRLQEILVDYNSEVKKGQVLARLDPLMFSASLEQARANAIAARGNLKKAKVQAEEAQRQFERVESLAAKRFVAEAELDTARSNADVARATAEAAEGQVAQTKAALRAAEINLSYTTIASPIDGIVVSRSVDVGQPVAASFQAPTLFVLAEDLRKMQVNTSVAEADVGKLVPGMAATFTVDAWPGEKFVGTVRQIRNAPQTVQNVVTYDAVIDVANPDVKLRPGMTANVTFVTGERDAVLKIPNAALRFKAPQSVLEAAATPADEAGGGGRGAGSGGGRGAGSGGGRGAGPGGAPKAPVPAEGQRIVWVLRDDRPVALSVKPGLTDGVVTEQVEGDLKAGDAVITDVSQAGGGGRRGMRLF